MTTEIQHRASWWAQGINITSHSQFNPQSIWLTGLSASGKTTIASLLKQQLDNAGPHKYLLDGDMVRTGLCRDLGFSVAGRIENLRRVAEVARLMVNARVTVLVSFISPFTAQPV